VRVLQVEEDGFDSMLEEVKYARKKKRTDEMDGVVVVMDGDGGRWESEWVVGWMVDEVRVVFFPFLELADGLTPHTRKIR